MRLNQSDLVLCGDPVAHNLRTAAPFSSCSVCDAIERAKLPLEERVSRLEALVEQLRNNANAASYYTQTGPGLAQMYSGPPPRY